MKRCFQAEFPDVFDGLRGADLEITMMSMQSEFLAYKRGMETLVTARNQLLELYRLACLYIYQFLPFEH